jgi:hypothetical protein
MTTPTDIVQHQLAAYNARDVEAFVATYSPTITIMCHPSGQVLIEGIAELRKTYDDLFANSPNLHCEIVNRIVIGNCVIDHERVTGRGDAPPFNAVVIYEVQDGLIQRAWALRE